MRCGCSVHSLPKVPLVVEKVPCTSTRIGPLRPRRHLTEGLGVLQRRQRIRRQAVNALLHLRIEFLDDRRRADVHGLAQGLAGDDVDHFHHHVPEKPSRRPASGHRPLEAAPLQPHRHPDGAVRGGAAARGVALREYQVTCVLRVQHEHRTPIDVHDDDVAAGNGCDGHVLTAGRALRRDDNGLRDVAAEQLQCGVGGRCTARSGRTGGGRLAGNEKCDGLGARHGGFTCVLDSRARGITRRPGGVNVRGAGIVHAFAVRGSQFAVLRKQLPEDCGSCGRTDVTASVRERTVKSPQLIGNRFWPSGALAGSRKPKACVSMGAE